jgi:flagellar hook-associated protein 3 FlgL
MSIDRIATNAQSLMLQYQVQQAEGALSQTQSQVASGLVSTTYGGIGDKTAMMESAQSQDQMATAYASSAQLGANQVNLQDAQLNQLSTLAQQWQQDVTSSVANKDGSSLMSQAQSIFQQASQILNAQDSNGNYLFGGGNSTTPPFTANSLTALAAQPSAAAAFANGTLKTSVQAGPGQSVQIGVLASDIGAKLMQSLADVTNFNSGASGNLGTQMTDAQTSFLTAQITSAQSASQSINAITGANGTVYQQLQSAVTQQQSMSTLYKGFVSDIRDVDMAKAAANLSQNQVALQAALEVSARLGQVSLLNYIQG